MNNKFNVLLTVLILFYSSLISAQENNFINENRNDYDKCGYIDEETEQLHKAMEINWGYGYDSLLNDLNVWKINQFVKIDSIGLSVQQRPLWRLIISENPNDVGNKRTIHIHARTHPQETEGFWVTREMIKILLSENELAQRIRKNCVVYVIPMYNPDGVELEKTRYNANGIDLESNWYTFPNQPEVAALKASLTKLMSGSKPIEVALNMHSASDCDRYFVYHHENGTSVNFASMEKDFINRISNYFPEGFAPWSYFVSWASGTPLQYPESWFWSNYGENVMAITYEDMYRFSCSATGKYDSTANAILSGVADYMGIVTEVKPVINNSLNEFHLYQNYPNPFNPSTTISWQIPEAGFVSIKIYNSLGQEVETAVNEYMEAGTHSINYKMGVNLPSGIYFYQMQVNYYNYMLKMIYLK